jgi:hypothetical protein
MASERRALEAATRQMHVAREDRVLWLDPCGLILFLRDEEERGSWSDLVSDVPGRGSASVFEKVRWHATWLPWWAARSYYFLREWWSR